MSSPYVIELKNGYYPTEEEIDRLVQRFEQARQSGKPLIVNSEDLSIRRLDDHATTAQMARLLDLLALSPGEREFVRAALAIPADRDLWAVLADYLEERQNPVAVRFRDLAASRASPGGGPVVMRQQDSRRGALPVRVEQLRQALRLPPDARIVNVAMADDQRTVWLKVTHPELPEVPDNELTPTIEAVYEDQGGQMVFNGWMVRE